MSHQFSNQSPFHKGFARLLAIAFAILGLGRLDLAQAGLPEPGVRLYGTIALDGVAVTAADTGIRIEARRTADGPPIASYAMGSLTNAGNFYSIKVDAESALPLTDTNRVVIGGTLHLVVLEGAVERDRLTLVVAARGQRQRLDFGSPDTDGDGLSDAFELAHFGTSTAGSALLDSDNDGRPNLREFLQGTNPLEADGRHPADINPADDRLTLGEVTDYILAWKTGATNWPVEPTLDAPNIEDYITRAGALWKGGEFYSFTNSPATNAPMWWVNRASTNAPGSDPGLLAANGTPKSAKALGGFRRRLPQTYQAGVPVAVTLDVAPEGGTRAYAVVEAVPAGWRVQNLSHDGRWDAVRRKVKWGPFFDDAPRTITYLAVPLSTSPDAARFAGRASFDGAGLVAEGPSAAWPEGRFPKPNLRLTAEPRKSVVVVGEPGRTYRLQQSDALGGWDGGRNVTVEASGLSVVPVEDGPDVQFFRLVSVE
jgi:hypothetical protein